MVTMAVYPATVDKHGDSFNVFIREPITMSYVVTSAVVVTTTAPHKKCTKCKPTEHGKDQCNDYRNNKRNILRC